jgi:hydroxyacylglutathione hydrolase
MLLRRFYDTKLAQASYLIGCAATGEAIVVDANRDVAQYLHAADAEGLRISHVTETHIHADFVSGSRELAERSGGLLLLSGEGGPDWSYAFAESAKARLLHDGDTFMVGNLRFQVMHTPGPADRRDHGRLHLCGRRRAPRPAREGRAHGRDDGRERALSLSQPAARQATA